MTRKRITCNLFQLQREQTGLFVRVVSDGMLFGIGHQTFNMTKDETADLITWLLETKWSK